MNTQGSARSKRLLSFALLALAVAALVLALIHFLGTPKDGGTPGATDAPEYTMLYEEPLPQFERVTVTVRGLEPFTAVADMAFDENGTLLGVMNQLAQPVVLKGQESFPFQAYAYQMLVLAAQHIPVTNQLPEDADPAAYGLDDPSITLRMAYKDGHERELLIGDLTPTGAGCYVRSDDGRIAIAPYDLYETLIGGLPAMHARVSTLGFTPDQVTGLSIQSGGNLIEIVKKKQTALLPFEQIAPFTHDVSTERLNAMLTALCAALPDTWAGTLQTDADAALYGLDAPRLTLTLIVQDQYITQYTVGGDAPDGNAYITLNHSGDVYVLDAQALAFMRLCTQDELLDRPVALVPITELSRVQIAQGSGEGMAHELSLTWGETASALADAYLRDGETLSRDAWTELYSALIAPQFDRVITEDERSALSDADPTNAVLTLTFECLDGSAIQIAYIPRDAHYMTVCKQGSPLFLIRREPIDALIRQWFGA